VPVADVLVQDRCQPNGACRASRDMTALNLATPRTFCVPSPSMGELPNTPNQIRVFVDNSYGKVVAAVALATGDAFAAEDGVQDAIVKVIRDGHEPDSLASWVTVVATNEVRQAQRRRAIETRVSQGSIEPPRDSTESIAVSTDVRSAISELPECQREIVLLHYYLDASVADTARAMEISEGTLKTQLHRVRPVGGKTLSSCVPGEALQRCHDHIRLGLGRVHHQGNRVSERTRRLSW